MFIPIVSPELGLLNAMKSIMIDKMDKSQMKTSWVIVYIATILLVGCSENISNNGEFDTFTDTPPSQDIEASGQNNSNSNHEIAVTVEPLSTEIPKTESSQFPNLLINVSVANEKFDCGQEIVYLYDFQRQEVIPLLSDRGINYRHPEWSPDGKWIAYIISNPNNGLDSVWIMDINGENHIKVSGDYPNINIGPETSCHLYAGLLGNIYWSHDSRYIAFPLYEGQGKGEYYITDIVESETVELVGDSGGSRAGWDSSDNTFVISHRRGLTIYVVNEISSIDMHTASYPNQYSNITAPEWLKYGETPNYRLQIVNSKIIGSIDLVARYKSGYLGIWEYDINEGTWMKVLETQDMGQPVFGRQNIFMFGWSGQLIFVTKDNWEEIGSYSFPGVLSPPTFNKTQMFLDYLEEDFVSFVGTIDGNYGIWADKVHREFSPNLIFNIDELSLPQTWVYIKYYSWKPIN